MSLVTLKDAFIRIEGRTILRDVNLRIEEGELVTIIGHNGAGKSTLLKLFTGFLTPQSGEVQVLGRDLGKTLPHASLRSLRGEIGQIFQGLCLVGRLTAFENVLIGALHRNRTLKSWFGMFPAVEKQTAYEALARVGLYDKAQQRVDRLSGGERQKVAIARAMVQKPRFILADEPTASLDPQAAEDILALLKDWAVSNRLSLVTVMHSINLLPEICERVVAMKEGSIIWDRPLGQVNTQSLESVYHIARAHP